jgi:hypothetical protein
MPRPSGQRSRRSPLGCGPNVRGTNDARVRGHAARHLSGLLPLVTRLLGLGQQVSIVWDNNRRRLCELTPGCDYAYDCAIDRRTIERAKAHIFVHVAGPLAEMRSGKRLPLDIFEEHDLNAHRIASWFIRNFVTVQAYVDFIYKRTDDYLNSHWEAVEIVARALLNHKTLAKRDVRRIIGRYTCSV